MRTPLLITVTFLILSATGCTTIPGTSQPAHNPPPLAPPINDPFHIDQPKNLAATPNPCELLNSQQLQQLNAGPASPNKSAWNQAACEWRNQNLSINIAPDTVQGDGIRFAAYTNSDTEKPTHHVNGYPSVHGRGQTKLRCSTVVGTSDKHMLYVVFHVGTEGRTKPEYQNPCAMSDKIAGMVLQNLPPV